jgi:hypothetical protein
MLVNQLSDVEAAIASGRDSLSLAMASAIGAVDEKPIRNRLLEVRRALFNGRIPNDARLAALAPAVDAALLDGITHSTNLLRSRAAILAAITDCYGRAVDFARDEFRRATGDSDFQAALALSSAPLFRNLAPYRDTGSALNASRRTQIERGLLRYFTRMSTKATPFSRFCAVLPGELQPDDGGRAISLEGVPSAKTSSVRLNKRIYTELAGALQRVPEVRDHLKVEPNPTLVVDGERFVFLTGFSGREAFRRVARSEVLDVVLELAGGAAPLSFAALAAGLSRDARCEASLDEATEYLERLLDIGFLRTRMIVAEQEAEWLEPLLNFLRPLRYDRAQACVSFLEDLRRITSGYGEATGEERAAAMSELQGRLQQVCALMKLPPFEAHDLALYEDATASARLVIRRTPAMEQALGKVADWVRLTLPLAGQRADLATMRHFYEQFYPEEVSAAGVPLLRFYEDFYREHFKAHLEKVSISQAGKPLDGYDVSNPFGLESVGTLRRAQGMLFNLLREKWAANPQAEEITITRTMVERALGPVASMAFDEATSVNLFSQVTVDGDGRSNPRVILPIGNYSLGFGKYFSRFLYMLPGRWTASLYEANARAEGPLLAEICGDAGFNANLHPPLLPCEISYPTGQGGGEASQVLCSQLSVRRDPGDAQNLILTRDTDGRRVWPLDLGFQNLLRRPPLYQLLTKFAPLRHFGVQLPVTPEVVMGGHPPLRVIHRPRISFEGSVVLSRRTWLVPGELVPPGVRNEADADYYLRIARWRRDIGLPRQVYVKVRPIADTPEPTSPVVDDSLDDELSGTEAGDGVEAGPERPTPRQAGRKSAPASQASRSSRDYRKPQFIDFESPLLVQLFSRVATGLHRFELTIEECLPTAEQLPVGPAGPYAFEMIMQLSFAPESR